MPEGEAFSKSQESKRHVGTTVAFFSIIRAFVSSLEGTEAAREKELGLKLRLPSATVLIRRRCEMLETHHRWVLTLSNLMPALLSTT